MSTPLHTAIRSAAGAWPTERRRPTVFARRGMVVSAHPLAAAAGLRVLADGGNAFDAAITTALVEGVTLPWACGLGGDMFCILYDAASRRYWSVCGSGAAPAAASADELLDRGFTGVPLHGPLAATVPGAVDAYLLLRERFGTRPLDQLAEPAVTLAADGFAVTPRLAHYLQVGAKVFGRSPSWSAAFMPHDHLPQTGEVFRQPDLARTLDTLGRDGREAFYLGEIAASIVGATQAAGGLFTHDDFAAHRSEIVTPIRTTYRGVQVYQTAPPSQGSMMLAMLNVLEGFPLGQFDPLSADMVHLQSEAKKVAFADHEAHRHDPSSAEIPLKRLLSKQHAASLRAGIDMLRAQPNSVSEDQQRRDTTYFCIADDLGNVVSFSHSLAGLWGNGVVAGETGILLNNRAARSFTLAEGRPDRLLGGRRPPHSLNCYVLADRDGPLAAGGTPGADLGMQWSVQVIVSMLDHGLDPQAAIELPRWHSFPGHDPSHRGQPADLQLENRFRPEVVQELRRRGHRVRLLPPWGTAAGVQVVAMDREQGTLLGASDPRTEGIALGI